MTYHYTECGLDTVWLENGYAVHETAYGEGVSIDDTEGLHRAIGDWLIEAPRPLNGAEVRFIRLEMELTQRSLAARLGVEEQAVRRWEKARAKTIPGPGDRLLRVLYRDFLTEGGGSVTELVNRLAELDRVDIARINFCVDGRNGWRTDCVQAA